MKSSVLVALRVRASPERAFDAFTREIGEWWRPGPLFAITPHGDGFSLSRAKRAGGSSPVYRTEGSSR
jgi:hypothetical protein